MELAVTCENLELFLERSKNAGDLLGRAFTVLGGKHPQRDRWNLEFNAPVKQVVQLIGTCHVDIVRMIQVIFPAEPPIAIQDQSDMAGNGRGSNVAQQSMLVNPINWREQLIAALACKLPPP